MLGFENIVNLSLFFFNGFNKKNLAVNIQNGKNTGQKLKPVTWKSFCSSHKPIMLVLYDSNSVSS